MEVVPVVEIPDSAKMVKLAAVPRSTGVKSGVVTKFHPLAARFDVNDDFGAGLEFPLLHPVVDKKRSNTNE